MLSIGKKTIPIGLDIGTNLFRAAQLTPGGPKPVLANYSSIKVPVGAVVEGEIVDVEAAAFAITQLWRSAGFSTKDVIVGIASQRVVVRLVGMSYMDQSELNSAIQFQAQDYIPIPVEEAILDAHIVSEYLNDEEEKMMDVLLVAAQRDMVNNTVAAVEAAGLRPQIIDLAAFAVVRALISDSGFVLPEGDDETQEAGSAVAIVNISAGLTNIVVIEEGVPRFARVTPLAGNDLTQSIADALGVTFDDAEELKTKVGLPSLDGNQPQPAAIADNLAMHVEAAQAVMENQVSHFIAEIRRSLDYYLTQATQARNITKVILIGGGARLNNFSAYLERNLQVRVEIGRPLDKVQVNPKIAGEFIERDEQSLAVSLGLALRSFQ